MALALLIASGALSLGQAAAPQTRAQSVQDQSLQDGDILSLYQQAQGALSRSLELFGSDRVEAFDALRDAGTLLPEVTRDLTPALQGGLEATLRRSEEAIVNQSETDFAVQRAVLGGGLQRALYEAALKSLNGGDTPRARELLEVLAGDLSLRPSTFEASAGDNSAQTLQYAFEHRLAARSLAQLGALPRDDQSRAYRGLARLYGDLLTVQGSPRLPAGTTAALLGAVDGVVAGTPLGEPLGALHTHLSAFAGDAQDAYAAASAGPAAPPSENPASSAEAKPADESVGDETGASESAVGEAVDETTRAGRAEQRRPTPLLGEQPPEAFAVGTAENVTDEAPAELPSNAAGDVAGQEAAEANGGVFTGVLTPITEFVPLLLALTGVLALVAGLRAAGMAAAGRTPWHNTALALLLVPAVLEGAAALAPLARRLTGGVGWFAPLEALSVVRQPVQQPALQLVWAFLVAVAVLCLARGWRAQSHPTRSGVQGGAEDGSAGEAKRAAPKTARTPGPVSVHARPTAATLDWDEDF